MRRRSKLFALSSSSTSSRRRPQPGSEEFKELLGARPAAIEVLTQALRSKDQVCRAESAYAFSFCGPDAMPVVPTLEAFLADPDEAVQGAAIITLETIQGAQAPVEAMRKIKGTQDETRR